MNLERDDLDRLYEKMEWENPRPNFTGRVMARARLTRRIQRVSAAISLVALGALGVFAFALGRGLTLSGAFDYIGVLLTNLDLVGSEADLFAQALTDVIPWMEMTAVLLSLMALWIASVALTRLLTRWQSHSS